ncbi:SWIB-domain-containing protein [Hymenopellis radicata]|nr:SWIB-domain-containing protein [Hymenopellis radicata]
MSLDLSAIAPLVRVILTRPETDLSTITARGVRKQLPELDESLTPSFLKENKEELEEIIAAEFERISPHGGSGSEEGQEEDDEEERTHKRKRDESDGEEDDEDENDEDDEVASPKKKPKKATPKKASPKKSEVLSDAELARQLSHEINGRERRSTARGGKKAANGVAKPKRGGRTKKSAATVDSDSEAEGSPSKKPKAKRASTGGARGGFAKEHALSAPLAALLETDRLSRPQCVKKLWEYIKANNLQNPNDRREILGDEKFKAVFAVDRLHMMRMNKLLGQHLHELPTV